MDKIMDKIKKLLDDMSVEAVVSLPVSHFHTSIPLFLLVFKNVKSEKPILFIDLAADINKRKDKDLVVQRLKDVLELYNRFINVE